MCGFRLHFSEFTVFFKKNKKNCCSLLLKKNNMLCKKEKKITCHEENPSPLGYQMVCPLELLKPFRFHKSCCTT